MSINQPLILRERNRFVLVFRTTDLRGSAFRVLLREAVKTGQTHRGVLAHLATRLASSVRRRVHSKATVSAGLWHGSGSLRSGVEAMRLHR